MSQLYKGIKSELISFLSNSTSKLTPVDCVKFIKQKFNINRNEIRRFIDYMISDGELEYTQIYGHTCIELSFNKPVRVSEHIVLKPKNITYKHEKNDIVVTINRGISFGSGSHPTTQLCLKAIDHIFFDYSINDLKKKSGLDIGTGSGVLAVTAAKFGLGNIQACDIDKISLNECRLNCNDNNLNDKVTVSENIPDERSYHYIFANLRFPTLKDLSETIHFCLKSNGIIIISGFYEEEFSKIMDVFCNRLNMELLWKKSKNQWCCTVFKKPDYN